MHLTHSPQFVSCSRIRYSADTPRASSAPTTLVRCLVKAGCLSRYLGTWVGYTRHREVVVVLVLMVWRQKAAFRRVLALFVPPKPVEQLLAALLTSVRDMRVLHFAIRLLCIEHHTLPSNLAALPFRSRSQSYCCRRYRH